MRLATYNVNGINGRLPVLLYWFAATKPDVACLQELKAPAERFPDDTIFTFWDYSRNALARDAGLRIDHLMLNPVAAKTLKRGGVDRSARALPKSSDHAPTWIELA